MPPHAHARPTPPQLLSNEVTVAGGGIGGSGGSGGGGCGSGGGGAGKKKRKAAPPPPQQQEAPKPPEPPTPRPPTWKKGIASSDDDPIHDKDPHIVARAGDDVFIYWSNPRDQRGWWEANVKSVGEKGKCVVVYEVDKDTEYIEVLDQSTHHRTAKARSHGAWKFLGGGIGRSKAAAIVTGCALCPQHRMLVVAKRFWDDLRRLRKHVEFRPADSLTKLTPGMCLLLCAPIADRRDDHLDMLHAEIVGVPVLSLSDALTRFPNESSACDLPELSRKWKGGIGCVMVKGVRPAPEFVCLAPGNQGFSHQFSQDKGTPQFCARVDVGKMVTVLTVRRGKVKVVQHRLINLDSHLTDDGYCLPNACSGSTQSAIESSRELSGNGADRHATDEDKVTHPQK